MLLVVAALRVRACCGKMIVFAFWSKEQTNYHPCISPDRV
eukprot:COSAG06_NODE_44557_length_362_cov_0.973384_1_plen_39_part_10